MQCTLRKQYHVPSDLEIMETLSKDHIRLAGNPFDLQLQEFWTTMGTQSQSTKLQLKTTIQTGPGGLSGARCV